MNKINYAFFGTDNFSISVLNEMKKRGFIPSLIVTVPDSKQGRGLKITESPVKIWAKENNIETYTPNKLDDEAYEYLKKINTDLYVVASYGLIIPKRFLEIPKYKALNVHPSLLPLYRGSSPVESAILDDSKETGVTIMRMDEQMDHGPIIDQSFMIFEEWPEKTELLNKLATEGGRMLTEIIPLWINKEIDEQEQNHQMATYTKKITKDDGLVDLDSDDPYKIFLKYKALRPWPGIYFFYKHKDKKIRVKITKAHFDNGLVIEEVIPEGKKPMDYQSFIRGFSN